MTEPACYLCCRALSSLQFRCENHQPARLFCSENHLNLHKPGQGECKASLSSLLSSLLVAAADCLPWSIEASPQYGRYLVASRDIQPGEEVLQEEALCWGPQHAATASLCLECLDQVGEEEEEVCGSCGYPLCGRHGESGSHPTHSLECAVFTRNNHRLGPEDRLDLELHYPLVEMVRCLVLMETSQEVSSTLAMLMDHGEERRAEPEKYLEPYRDLITQLVTGLKLGAEEEILKIIGYFDVNSLAVRSDQGSYAGRGLYPVASLMSHDCVCNTRNIITGRALQCRATVFIPAGSSITTHYVSPLLDITARRARLREKWFFDCSCARCEDTTGTDLGTFLSALRCPACTAGFSLPVLSEAPAQFRCEVCRHSLPAAQALHTIKMWEPLIQVSSLSFRASVASLLVFFSGDGNFPDHRAGGEETSDWSIRKYFPSNPLHCSRPQA